MATITKEHPILFKINRIMQELFDLDLEEYKPEALEKPLLSNYFKLEARDLLYLFFEVEKKFNISITQEDILNGNFKTINGIIDIIKSQQKMKTYSN